MNARPSSHALGHHRSLVCLACVLALGFALQVATLALDTQIPLSAADVSDHANISTGPPREEGKDYSGTNNQESGVEEADFVKTDGSYIYILNGNRLQIYGVPLFGSLESLAAVEVEGWPEEMLSDQGSGRIAVFSSVDPRTLPVDDPLRAMVGARDRRGIWQWRAPVLTKITVVEAADRRVPRLSQEIYLEAEYRTARLVDRSLRLGAFSRRVALGGDRPRVYQRLPDGTVGVHDVRSFHQPTIGRGHGITTLLTLDLADAGSPFDADQIVTGGSVLYVSTDWLYVVETAHDWWWFWWNDPDEDVTNVHAFDISNPGETRYVGSGRVPGTVGNSFSMSEKHGVLRVVTTTPGPANAGRSTELLTLRAGDGRLIQVGHLAGLDTGTPVGAVRFAGDRAYIKTVANAGAFLGVDVADPTNPRLLGELKVPGVSTYLHTLGDRRLLAIGWGGDDQRPLSPRVQVTLFDVSDERYPALLDTAAQDVSSWSEALADHKAFQYWPPERLLAVPVSSVEGITSNGGLSDHYVSNLEIVAVADGGLAARGRINHSALFNCASHSLRPNIAMRRGLFMGDFLYAVSQCAITVHRLSDLSLVESVELRRPIR